MTSMLLYQKRFDVLSGFRIRDCLVDFGNLKFRSQVSDLFMQLGMDGQKVKISAYVAHRILRRTDDMQRLEGDQLRLNFNTARCTVLTGNQIYTSIAENVHPLYDRCGSARAFDTKIDAKTGLVYVTDINKGGKAWVNDNKAARYKDAKNGHGYNDPELVYYLYHYEG